MPASTMRPWYSPRFPHFAASGSFAAWASSTLRAAASSSGFGGASRDHADRAVSVYAAFGGRSAAEAVARRARAIAAASATTDRRELIGGAYAGTGGKV